MKKISALFLSIILALGLIASPVSAAGIYKPLDEAEPAANFTVQTVCGEAGTDVSVDFSVDGQEYQTGTSMLQVKITYDPELLSYNGTSLTKGSVWIDWLINVPNASVMEDLGTPGEVEIMALFPKPDNCWNFWENEGVIFTMNFHIDEEAPNGTYIPLTIDIESFGYIPQGQMTDIPIPHAVTNGAVYVGTEIPATPEPPTAEPPTAEPPTAEPPTAEPPTAEPPTAEPPTDEPPTEEPPTAEPPTAEPPTAEPPTAEPPTEEPPTAEPPTEEPPTAEPPTAEPPTAEPPTAEPPTAEPPTAEPPTEEPTITPEPVILKVGTVEGERGTDVLVDFTIEGLADNYEAHALTVVITYDQDKLTLVGNELEQGAVWDNIKALGGQVVYDLNTPGMIKFMAAVFVEPFSIDGTVFTMKFHIAEDVPGGIEIPLNLTVSEFDSLPLGSAQGIPIPYTAVSGAVTIPTDIYTVIFKDWDGTVLKIETVEHGSAATAPEDPERVGYTFTGWDKPFDNVTEDLIVTAQYAVNQYTITYTINGEPYMVDDGEGNMIPCVQTYDYGAAVTAPEYTVPEGYTFTGWEVPEIMPAENITLDATLTVNTFTVTFLCNDGSGEVFAELTDVEYGSTIAAPDPAPECEGYRFEGWFLEDMVTPWNFAEDTVTEDTNLFAKWTRLYNVTFDPDGGTLPEGAAEPVQSPLAEGETFIIPACPYEKEGYTFTGWNDGTAIYQPGDTYTMPADDVTLTAVWELNILLGDYDCNGVVDIQDAILTLRAAMGLITPSEQSLANADIDFNGVLTVIDAVRILRAAMGLLEL